jgi:Fuc2NAc and GlcNAc transferase
MPESNPFSGLLVLLGALAFTLALLGTRALIVRAARLRLIDAPNARSSHDRPTPSAGGLAIVAASLPIGAWLFLRADPTDWPWLLAALGIALLGLWDDYRPLPKRVRLAGQFLACTALVGVLFGTVGLPDLPAWQWLPLAALCIVAGAWWINLFNFMDGIDGIATTQAVFMLVAGAAALATQPDAATSPSLAWMLVLAAACLGFLPSNWARARIFMGDVGSTYLAYTILALAALTVVAGWLSPAFWLILGALFVADSGVTLARRMITGQRWTEAHRSHAYQRLARRWGSHARVTGLAVAINAFWLAPLAWLALTYPDRAWGLLVAAYLPLLGGVYLLGAGLAED